MIKLEGGQYSRRQKWTAAQILEIKIIVTEKYYLQLKDQQVENMITNTAWNTREIDVLDSDPAYMSGEQYYLAQIDTPFHNGEAVVKFDRDTHLWNCLFTLRDKIVAAVCGFQIGKMAIVRIIREQSLESFDDFVGCQSYDQRIV